MYNNFINLEYYDYVISAVISNILVYFLVTYSFFCLMFLFDLKYFKTLSDIKNVNILGSLSIFFFLSVLSLAGVPPLLGFAGKFFLFVNLVSSGNFVLNITLIVLNFFALFFYIQNLRFSQTKKIVSFFIIKNNKNFINSDLILMLIVFNIVNIFGVFIFNDIFIYTTCLVSYI